MSVYKPPPSVATEVTSATKNSDNIIESEIESLGPNPGSRAGMLLPSCHILEPPDLRPCGPKRACTPLEVGTTCGANLAHGTPWSLPRATLTSPIRILSHQQVLRVGQPLPSVSFVGCFGLGLKRKCLLLHVQRWLQFFLGNVLLIRCFYFSADHLPLERKKWASFL